MESKIINGEEVRYNAGSIMGFEFLDHRDKYAEFIASKVIVSHARGLAEVPDLHPKMHPHQRDVTQWALRLGKSAAFLGTGLGKTLIELEWSRIIAAHEKEPVLILAPLAVARQTVREAEKFGLMAHYCADMDAVTQGVNITNYERLEKFDVSEFAGIVLDESSILKSFDGKTRSMLIESFRDTPWRLAATATPAPNDYMELGNHSEFLGVMTATEMLSTFFVHDGGETQKWRLKGHARKEFWKWVCSWAVSINKPSDIGHSDEGFDLPPLIYHEHIIEVDTPSDGMLFAMPAETLGERIGARRTSIAERVAKAVEIVESDPEETWLLWSNMNDESTAVTAALPLCVEVTGSDSDEHKVNTAVAFTEGGIPYLSTKAKMWGYGMNLQICSHQVFVGVNDSWEQFYQAVRRSWRFGQTNPVHIHIIAASTEGNVLENLKRKEKEATHMAEEMVANMQELTRMHLRGTVRDTTPYVRDMRKTPNWELHLADCVELANEMPSNSAHFSVFSPPFASLYTYSPSERDMGNSRTHDEFWKHYRFLINESFRVMMPGRLVSIHCMNLPTSKVRDGYIGLRDFRGEIIKAYEDAGFIYHSEVCIWKDPVTAMQRTKALGLLHKTIRKDSSMSRQGVPDYLVTMRKPGDNPQPIGHSHDDFPVQLWQNYASPIWMDINTSDTLQYRSAREHEDERHICPLQLEVIRRAIKLWSNPGDTVWSPFAGIGSEGFVALEMGRKYIGSELKRSYYEQACRNLGNALSESAGLFAGIEEDVEDEEEVEA
jgi:DNA modification methylase